MDPMTLGIAGAGIGAMMNKDNPIQGAALGGLGGYMGGAAMGIGAGGSAAAQAAPGMAGMTGGAANNMAYGALPTMTGSAPGSQAAMLAAQTAEFGTPGLLATGDAMNAGGMTGKAFGMGNKFAFGGGQDPNKMMQAGQMMGKMGGEQPRQQMQPRAQLPMPQPRPYQPTPSPYEQQRMMGYNYAQPSILPGFGR